MSEEDDRNNSPCAPAEQAGVQGLLCREDRRSAAARLRRAASTGAKGAQGLEPWDRCRSGKDEEEEEPRDAPSPAPQRGAGRRQQISVTTTTRTPAGPSIRVQGGRTSCP